MHQISYLTQKSWFDSLGPFSWRRSQMVTLKIALRIDPQFCIKQHFLKFWKNCHPNLPVRRDTYPLVMTSENCAGLEGDATRRGILDLSPPSLRLLDRAWWSLPLVRLLGLASTTATIGECGDSKPLVADATDWANPLHFENSAPATGGEFANGNWRLKLRLGYALWLDVQVVDNDKDGDEDNAEVQPAPAAATVDELSPGTGTADDDDDATVRELRFFPLPSSGKHRKHTE